MNNIMCNNCLKYGHYCKYCKMPITSYGIILFRKRKEKYPKNNITDNYAEVDIKNDCSGDFTNYNYNYEYLMIRRKDTFGYIDFIRGNYSLKNISHLQTIIDEMSIDEKNKLLNNSYEYLRNEMWQTNITPDKYNSEEQFSKLKFENLKNDGILEELINNSKTNWNEPEWEFPKGRKNINETELETAIREFEEETGYLKKNINIVENITPYEEVFIGSNFKLYKHKYYLAYIDNIYSLNADNENNILDNFQTTEVSKIEWKNINECINSIRPFAVEKKNIIMNVDNLLNEFEIKVKPSIYNL